MDAHRQIIEELKTLSESLNLPIKTVRQVETDQSSYSSADLDLEHEIINIRTSDPELSKLKIQVIKSRKGV